MKTIIVIFSLFCFAFAASLYGARMMQLESDNQFLYHPNPFQAFCAWLANPGYRVALEVIPHPPDIPEDAPEPWASRWIVASSAGLVWGALFSAAYLIFTRYVLSRPSPNVAS